MYGKIKIKQLIQFKMKDRVFSKDFCKTFSGSIIGTHVGILKVSSVKTVFAIESFYSRGHKLPSANSDRFEKRILRNRHLNYPREISARSGTYTVTIRG